MSNRIRTLDRFTLRVLLLCFGILAFAPRLVAAQTVEYYHLDALGSVRAVTDQSGAVIERHDYLPFGDEVNPSSGAQPRQFTGHERDAETGMDYFGARYYSGKRARFTTVDPVTTLDENLGDPQRWNRYAYVRNNPLRHTDPDGRIIWGLLDIALSANDVRDAIQTWRDPSSSTWDRTAVVVGTILGVVGPGSGFGRALKKVDDVGVEIVQRAMSRKELEAIESTGLIRGGRGGAHHVSDSVNSSAQRARERLALAETPEVRATLEVPAGRFSSPTKVAPKNGMPGGGTERIATGPVPAKVIRADEMKK